MNGPFGLEAFAGTPAPRIDLALRITCPGGGTAYDTNNTAITADVLAGDLRVSWYVETGITSASLFGLVDSTSPAASNNYQRYKAGVQLLNSTQLYVWENGSNTLLTVPTYAAGDVLTLRRVAGVSRLYLNNALTHTYATNTTADLYGCATFATTSTRPIVATYFGNLPPEPAHIGSNTAVGRVTWTK